MIKHLWELRRLLCSPTQSTFTSESFHFKSRQKNSIFCAYVSINFDLNIEENALNGPFYKMWKQLKCLCLRRATGYAYIHRYILTYPRKSLFMLARKWAGPVYCDFWRCKNMAVKLKIELAVGSFFFHKADYVEVRQICYWKLKPGFPIYFHFLPMYT
jgi:hypothetical protein